MISRTGIRRVFKRIKSYRWKNVVEIHDHLHTEGTQHIVEREYVLNQGRMDSSDELCSRCDRHYWKKTTEARRKPPISDRKGVIIRINKVCEIKQNQPKQKDLKNTPWTKCKWEDIVSSITSVLFNWHVTCEVCYVCNNVGAAVIHLADFDLYR